MSYPRTSDEFFEALINGALQEADGINCSLEDYMANLRAWISAIQLRIECAEGDLRRERERNAKESR